MPNLFCDSKLWANDCGAVTERNNARAIENPPNLVDLVIFETPILFFKQRKSFTRTLAMPARVINRCMENLNRQERCMAQYGSVIQGDIFESLAEWAQCEQFNLTCLIPKLSLKCFRINYLELARTLELNCLSPYI